MKKRTAALSILTTALTKIAFQVLQISVTLQTVSSCYPIDTGMGLMRTSYRV